MGGGVRIGAPSDRGCQGQTRHLTRGATDRKLAANGWCANCRQTGPASATTRICSHRGAGITGHASATGIPGFRQATDRCCARRGRARHTRAARGSIDSRRTWRSPVDRRHEALRSRPGLQYCIRGNLFPENDLNPTKIWCRQNIISLFKKTEIRDVSNASNDQHFHCEVDAFAKARQL